MSRLKIRLAQGLLICRAKILNQRKSVYLKLALDTGATTTIIPPEAAIKIGLNPAGTTEIKEITTGSGRIVCPIVIIPTFICLGQKISSLKVFCHTLPPESPVEGLLGLDFLKRFDVHINFKKGTLEIS